MHFINTHKKLVLLVLVAILVVSMVSKFPFYKGDGKLISNGWFRLLGYRHEIHFEEFSVQEGQVDQQYQFSGVPNESYVLKLNVVPNIPPSQNPTVKRFRPVYRSLTDAQVEIEVKLIEDGKDLVHLKKAPSRTWVFSRWTIFHKDFLEVQFQKHPIYNLQITIDSKSALPEPVIFQPSLFGGQRRVF